MLRYKFRLERMNAVEIARKVYLQNENDRQQWLGEIKMSVNGL